MVLEKTEGNQALCKDSTDINHNLGKKKKLRWEPHRNFTTGILYWDSKAIKAPNSLERF